MVYKIFSLYYVWKLFKYSQGDFVRLSKTQRYSAYGNPHVREARTRLILLQKSLKHFTN